MRRLSLNEKVVASDVLGGNLKRARLCVMFAFCWSNLTNGGVSPETVLRRFAPELRLKASLVIALGVSTAGP